MQAPQCLFLIVAAAGISLSVDSAFAADPGVCNAYANNAVGDFKTVLKAPTKIVARYIRMAVGMLTISITITAALQRQTRLGWPNRRRGGTF
jgi:hypothetical protein